MLHHRPARPSDAWAINLREEDRAEAALALGPGREAEALERTIRNSSTATATFDKEGRLVALWGRSVSLEGVHPWLMCSDALAAHPRALLGIAREFVEDCRREGRPVWNLVSREAAQAHRFIRRLGFHIEPLPRGPYHLFILPRHVS